MHELGCQRLQLLRKHELRDSVSLERSLDQRCRWIVVLSEEVARLQELGGRLELLGAETLPP